MSYNPKLEFFTFPLNHKEKDKTFRDFAIECLDVDKTKTDQEVFKACFEYFMSIPESGFAENDRLKKVLTWINNKDVNIHYDKNLRYFQVKMYLQELLQEANTGKMVYCQIWKIKINVKY